MGFDEERLGEGFLQVQKVACRKGGPCTGQGRRRKPRARQASSQGVTVRIRVGLNSGEVVTAYFS